MNPNSQVYARQRKAQVDRLRKSAQLIARDIVQLVNRPTMNYKKLAAQMATLTNLIDELEKMK